MGRPTRLLVGRRAWITSASWRHFTEPEKVIVLRAWFKENGLICQTSLPRRHLPKNARRLLREASLEPLLHTFCARSGSNCVATAAAFATGNLKLLSQWMVWKPFFRHLSRSGYREVAGDPAAKDILLFAQNGMPKHAAIYLGAGIWFEKPGQDFYEPYRLVRFRNWRKEWPLATLTIYRRAERDACATLHPWNSPTKS